MQDQGQTNHELDFQFLASYIMTHICENQCQRSADSNVSMEIDGWKDRHDWVQYVAC